MKDRIENIVYNFFINSSDFNGIPLRNISQELKIDYENSIDLIKELVKDDIISIQSSTNPHIIGFKHYPVDSQIRILEEAKKIKEVQHTIGEFTISSEDTEFPICLYPSKSYLQKKRDLSEFDNSTYSKQLALGKPQLKPIFFEIEGNINNGILIWKASRLVVFFWNKLSGNDFFFNPLLVASKGIRSMGTVVCLAAITAWLPATNIKEGDKNYEIEMAVPGMKKEDITLEMEGGLTAHQAYFTKEGMQQMPRIVINELTYYESLTSGSADRLMIWVSLFSWLQNHLLINGGNSR